MNTLAQDLFSQARELPSAERDAFLAEACGDDAELHLEVQRMLVEAARADSFFGDGATLGAEEFKDSYAEKEGDVVGPYKLRQSIGEGGFGTVWMAEQSVPISRMVALKVIKAGMDTKQVLARFEAERQALAMMDHPHIAKVLDAGTTPAGRPWFSMELVKGIPITDYCNEAGLGIKERLALFRDVCSAINHAHQKGVIHRDIKPSNVMVTLHGDQPVVKVIDFGIAKATQGKLTDQTLFTRFEQMIGTPVYMSPEQAGLSGLDIDTRSDIYALGILLYELLVGKPPFDSKSLVSAGYEEMRRIIREVEPVKPSSRLGTIIGAERTLLAKAHRIDEAKLNNLVEPDLDWIVMKAIEKDRSRRYETANAFAQDIVRFLSDEPVTAIPPSAGYKFRKFAKRNKAALRVGAGIAVLLVAATAVSSWQAVRATKAEKKAADTAIAERAARNESEQINEFLVEIFRSSDPSQKGREVKVADMLDGAVKKIEEGLDGQPIIQAGLRLTLAATYEGLGLYKEAVGCGEAALATYRKLLGPEHPDTLVALQRLGVFYLNAGEPQKAVNLLEEAVPLFENAYGPESANAIRAKRILAGCWTGLGFTGQNLAHAEKALRLLTEQIPISVSVLGETHRETLRLKFSLVQCYQVVNRDDDVIALSRTLLPQMLAHPEFGRRSPDTLVLLDHLANSYSRKKDWNAALKTYEEELLPVSELVLGADHSRHLQRRVEQAGIYSEAGMWEEARRRFEVVVPIYHEKLPDHDGRPWVNWLAANNLLQLGRFEEAIALYEAAITLERDQKHDNFSRQSAAGTGLAYCYDGLGQEEKAFEILKALNESLPDALQESTPALVVKLYLARSYAGAGDVREAQLLIDQILPRLPNEHQPGREWDHVLAEAYYKMGNLVEALRLRRQVHEVRNNLLGPEHPDTLRSMTALAVSLGAAKEWPEAIALQEKAVDAEERLFPREHPDLRKALENLLNLHEAANHPAETEAVRAKLARWPTKADADSAPNP